MKGPSPRSRLVGGRCSHPPAPGCAPCFPAIACSGLSRHSRGRTSVFSTFLFSPFFHHQRHKSQHLWHIYCTVDLLSILCASIGICHMRGPPAGGSPSSFLYRLRRYVRLAGFHCPEPMYLTQKCFVRIARERQDSSGFLIPFAGHSKAYLPIEGSL